MKKKVILRRLKRKLGEKAFAEYMADKELAKINLVEKIKETPEEVLIQPIKKWWKIWEK